MAIFLGFLAGSFVGLGNFFMRKSMDGGGSAQRFLVFQMFVACLFLSVAEPLRQESFRWSLPVLGMGMVAGVLLAFMLFLLGKALAEGPSGLTFSLLSSAAVLPALVMTFFFGSQHGFIYTFQHALGSLLVLIGLFWGGKSLLGFKNLSLWLVFAICMFLAHVLLLSLFQWRAFLLHVPHPEDIASFVSFQSVRSPWFLPIMFFTAGIIEWGIYNRVTEVYQKAPSEPVPLMPQSRNRLFNHSQYRSSFYGVLGGVTSGLTNLCLICSVEWASCFEHAVIFPIFSVATIVISNLWSQKFYQERVNWPACALCLLGIVVGTIDWQSCY